MLRTLISEEIYGHRLVSIDGTYSIKVEIKNSQTIKAMSFTLIRVVCHITLYIHH